MADNDLNLQKLKFTCKFCSRVTVILQKDLHIRRRFHAIDCRWFNIIETDDGSIFPHDYEDKNIFQIEVFDKEEKSSVQVEDDDNTGLTVTGHTNNKNIRGQNNDICYAEVTLSVASDQNYQTESGIPSLRCQSHETEGTPVVTGHHDTNKGCPSSCYQSHETSEQHDTEGRVFPHVLQGAKYEMAVCTGTICFINICLPAVLGTIFQRCIEDSSIFTTLKASKLSSSKIVIEIGTHFHYKRYGEAMKIFADIFGIPQREDTVDFCPNPRNLSTNGSDKTRIAVETAIQKLFPDVQITNAVGHYEQYITSFFHFIEEKRQRFKDVPVQTLLREWLTPEAGTERSGFENEEYPVLLMLPMRFNGVFLFTSSRLIDRSIKVYNSRYELLSLIIWKPHHVTCYFLVKDEIIYYNNGHKNQNFAQISLQDGEEAFNFIDRKGEVLIACYRLLE